MRKLLIVPALLLATPALLTTPALLATPAWAQTDDPAPMTGVRPMHGQSRQAAPRGTAAGKPSKPRQGMAADAGSPTDMSGNREYQGGVGSPTSTQASNTGAANTRSEIAPRLPDPNAASSTPEAYLAAARSALAAGKTGMAQEALERAETRILSRSTDPSMAASPADMPMVRQIGAARQALANRDTRGAQAAIGAAMGAQQ